MDKSLICSTFALALFGMGQSMSFHDMASRIGDINIGEFGGSNLTFSSGEDNSTEIEPEGRANVLLSCNTYSFAKFQTSDFNNALIFLSHPTAGTSNYSPGTTCQSFVFIPENSPVTIRIEFFDVYKNSNGNCDDRLDIARIAYAADQGFCGIYAAGNEMKIPAVPFPSILGLKFIANSNKRVRKGVVLRIYKA